MAGGGGAQFPRLEREVYLNAVGGTPLAAFAAEGMGNYEDFNRPGLG